MKTRAAPVLVLTASLQAAQGNALFIGLAAVVVLALLFGLLALLFLLALALARRL